MDSGAVIQNSPLADIKLNLVETLDDALRFRTWLSQRHENDVLGLDTESGGLSQYRDRLRLVQIGDKHTGWAFDYEGWRSFVQQTLNEWQGQWVLHNSTYDAQVFSVQAGYEMPWDRTHDTMSMAHLVDPSRPRGLKECADRLVDPRASAGQSFLHDGMREQGWNWNTVPIDFQPYWLYSALDPVLTAHMYDVLSTDVFGKYDLPYDIERGANRMCYGMMRKGVLTDPDYIHEKIAYLERYMDEAKTWLKSNYGVTGAYSPGTITDAFARLSVPILFWTDGGAPQFDKNAMKFYANQFPQAEALIRQIMGVRKASKTISTYFQNILNSAIDDVIHCQMWVMGADTGRMSISNPSLQNQPADDLVRGSFIARPGKVWLSCDYSQIESRLLAHFSRDAGLIEAFRVADETGSDFFVELGADIYRERISKSDKRRGLVKNTFYGLGYGAGLEKMAATAGVPVEQMAPVRNGLLESYPNLKRFMDKCIQDGRENAAYNGGRAFIKTPTGRRLVVEPGKEYALINRLVQGHAAEVLKQAALRVENAGLGDAMRIPVHDEFLLEVDESDAEDARVELMRAMEDTTSYSVPLYAHADIVGRRWKKT